MTIPERIHELIELFARNLDAYKSGHYNETQVRHEFIDPFFIELGWDVNNKKGYSEAYKDVIHEDSIKIGGIPKAPDYCFRVGGVRKFFLEAKKPSVDIKEDTHPVYQLRRYAWSAKLPLSILTDFEEFAVYDCRVRPVQTDKASKSRVIYYTFRDYAGKWDEIASIFSQEAIFKGSFDKYVESSKLKRGTAEVDKAFLTEIESWREKLAQNIALRNPGLSRREMNFAVQRTIDRLLFLRICEDRAIEDYGRLQGLLNGTQLYRRLVQIFYRADQIYNSGLFHFSAEKDQSEPPDDLSPSLKIDDKPLKDIIKCLYYPDSPYEFSVLPADILGQVYEQFLGKVIRLTPAHRAVVEDKPEVKKAGGVYYTPTYIVDYIVKNTVGTLLDGSTPQKASKLRILDPACGSGSFLIGAYQYLLDWHREWYENDNPEKWAKSRNPRLYKGPAGDWRLTTDERKRILLNNIYGVDIDTQAVEVTKLSLLLKVLEGENEQTLARQYKLFHQRALPNLSSNIKCGNSLIGPDFYDGRQLDLFDDEERYRINVFDWDTEFEEIMKGGGFDAVVGNPPYILLENEFRDKDQLDYFKTNFSCATYKIDTYHLFIEKSIDLTVKDGKCSLITPANYITNNYLYKLRFYMIKNSQINQLLVIDGGVFKKVSVNNAIFVLTARKNILKSFKIIHSKVYGDKIIEDNYCEISLKNVLQSNLHLFTGEIKFDKLWRKILNKSMNLSTIAYVNFGKQLRNRMIFKNDVISHSLVDNIPKNYVQCYTGKNISRYYVEWRNLICLNDRIAKKGGCWDESKHSALNKIITKQIGKNPEFAIDVFGYHCLNTIFMINIFNARYNQLFVLGVLNSSVIKKFWLDNYFDKRKTFPKIKGTYLKKLPIFAIDFSDPTDKARHDRMVGYVETMLKLHKQLAEANIAQDKTVIQRQIDATDRQIDRLVYELYNLTEEEIRIVNGE